MQQLTEILKLYPEDFRKTHIWNEVCEVCNIPTDSKTLVIEFVRTGTSEETLKELLCKK